jgi:hypothetical protein
MFELEEAVDSMDHFYVVSIDDLESDHELTIYPEGGQIIGILFFSQNSDLELDYDEIFLNDDRIMMYPTGDFAWALEEAGVYYWFVSYAIDRNAEDGEHQILYYAEQSDEELEFTVTFSFGNMLATDDIEDMANWEEFEEDVVEDIAVEEDLSDMVADWYEGCFDTNQGRVDSAGDDCLWYESHIDYCGYYDTQDFNANSMCCVCQYFADSVDLDDIYSDCEDTAGDARDSYNDGCEWYNEFPEGCGYYDDDDFDAVAMCCACADTEQAVYYTYEEDFEGAEFVDDELVADEVAEDVEEEEAETEEEDGPPEPIAADEIEIEDLEELDEEGWQDLAAAVDIHDPMMDWTNIAGALADFQAAAADAAGAYQVCVDTMENERDEWGNDCAMYTDYPGTCGAGDTDTFVAGTMCCACGGGSTAAQSTCEDTAGEAIDSDGFGCIWYDNNPDDCGAYDDDDFVAADVCCGCGGGDRDDFDPATAEVSSMAEIFEQADGPSDVFFAVVHNPQVILNMFNPFGGGTDDTTTDTDVVEEQATEEA